MREADIIRAVRSHLAVSAEQRNAPFASDAEIIEIGEGLLALTLDEFSAEDGLSTDDPGLLGWNVVVATLSDLLAVGAEPRFLLTSVVAAEDMAEPWLAAFSGGMQDALDAFGAFALGGDVGTDQAWRVTGCGLGTLRGRPLDRIVRAENGALVVTGALGDGNLAAAGGPTPRFECRLPEARSLAVQEAACIDTSDGLAVTLETFVKLNDGLSVTVDLDAVPYSSGIDKAASALAVPREAFLLGSAGEYELLAFVPESAAARLVGLTPIGSFAKGAPPGISYCRGSDCVEHERLPDPRGAADYRAQIVALARKLFG
jgi:thiamine-monophosphate kinase